MRALQVPKQMFFPYMKRALFVPSKGIEGTGGWAVE
jgi:hypothetical protein